MQVEIYVCLSGSCRRQGADSTLQELEEIVDAAGATNCIVRRTGCVGACGSGPNAVVKPSRGRQKLITRIVDSAKCQTVIQHATGMSASEIDYAMGERLEIVRQQQVRNVARKEGKWNIAMSGIHAQIASSEGKTRVELQLELARLFQSAGYLEEALGILVELEQLLSNAALEDVLLAQAKVFQKLGRLEEIDEVSRKISRTLCDPEDMRHEIGLQNKLTQIRSAKVTPSENRQIENYSLWTLCYVIQVSKHSAIYHFTSAADKGRGTPRLVQVGKQLVDCTQDTRAHQTWHTTLLAQVGNNSEGPLQWIERDYTPISTAQDWEEGRCDLLVKVYNTTGLATSWLHQQPIGCQIHLSRPMRTLFVPSLVENPRESKFKPASYLLILAETGIVAASQVLHHSDKSTCFGAEPVVTSPVSLIYSCRRDDVLMASDIMTWCKEGRLQHCTFAITETQQCEQLYPEAAAIPEPFPEMEDVDVAELSRLPNTTVECSRISKRTVAASITRLKKPFRVLVSGPAEFNAIAQSLLSSLGVARKSITLLSA